MSQGISLITTRQNYNRLSRWYDLISAGEKNITGIGLRLLNVQHGEKVLEIGFGTGTSLVELAGCTGEAGFVCGIDLSPGMFIVANRRIHQANMQKRVRMQVGDATHLPYPNNKFQVVFLSFTLELFDREKIPVVLDECQRILQPSGRLGIVSLAKEDVQAVHIYEWFHIHFPRIVDCRPIHVHEVLQRAGFIIAQNTEKRLWGLPVDAVVARKA